MAQIHYVDASVSIGIWHGGYDVFYFSVFHLIFCLEDIGPFPNQIDLSLFNRWLGLFGCFVGSSHYSPPPSLVVR